MLEIQHQSFYQIKQLAEGFIVKNTVHLKINNYKKLLKISIFISVSWTFLSLTQEAYSQSDNALSQTPIFVNQAQPPLNMLVMGRDHKLYYEAYNDASDIDNDGVIDIGYKPNKINYYGYFNNNICYTYTAGIFTPSSAATGTNKKQCSNQWSGDFLNYLTTSRMDALRKVLYGGSRVEDTTTKTILAGSYIPRDAHTWGKSYDPPRDALVYNISDYSPLTTPSIGTRHLFAVTTRAEAKGTIPELRVLNDSLFQIWNWVSKEGTAGQNQCIGNVDCSKSASSSYEMLSTSSYRSLTITTWKKSTSDATPTDASKMSSYFTGNAKSTNLCGSGSIAEINTSGNNNNPFAGINGCTHDNYLTEISGKIYIPAAGAYKFSVDGDDAVEALINGSTWGWYGGHGSNRSQSSLESHSKSINFSKAGWYDVRFRHVEGATDDNWGLAVKVDAPKSEIKDYAVKVEVCPGTASLREDSCKAYANNGKTIYKPTGLLHDFGENEKMYFGLITGSYQKNIAGGVLRRNIKSFKEEVNAETGQFRNDVTGVMANIDRQRVIGFNGSQYNACGWITDGPISEKPDPSICAMWGNPIAEMMYETMRYFAGEKKAHTSYDYGSGAKDSADPLNLTKENWIPPYETIANGGAGYLRCSKPAMTVLSDINPSYDSKVPGSRFSSFDAQSTALSDFNVSTEVRSIGSAEKINGNNYFIGQSNSSNADQTPSVKTIDDLSWARGLSPQEPSKEGTYYSAGVARFAANNSIFGNALGKNKLMTYAVALASPLPEIRFPVGGNNYVTVAPFAKSTGGGYGINTKKFTPTNQIVDYYVDQIANTGADNADPAINGGRPYAEFRINYEDVEQGADHDMDAIARYTIQLNPDNKVQIDMVSEYAAGGIIQYMGYVISGTSKDGTYLEIRDKDTSVNDSVYYQFNTPPGQSPGYCVNKSTDPLCKVLGLSSRRTFTPSATNASGSFLKDPLWYAAKYGMPGRDPSKIEGNPDNYFLVTNATTLKEQLTKAFNDILQNTASVTQVSVDMPTSEISNGANIYRTTFEAEYWSGDVIKEKIISGSRSKEWSAAEMLSERDMSSRKIYFAGSASGTPLLQEFTYSNISSYSNWLSALNLNTVTNTPDGKAEQRVNFLRGNKDDILRERKLLANSKPNVLGDIVNSSLVRVNGAIYRASAADKLEGTSGTNSYKTFAASLESAPEMLYVGANDGMLHAFKADDGSETFAFIPSSLRNTISDLTTPKYGATGKAHRYFVDGTSVVSDVYFDGAWRKILVGSLGAGGKQIFALDITSPTTPKLLWEFSSDDSNKLGYTMAQPSIARLNDNGAVKGKWVVILPNGYQGLNSASGEASLYVLDISNGSIIKRFDVAGGMTSSELASSLPLGNGLSRASAIDNNSDGKTDIVYAGDLLGNLWRFDMQSGDSSTWSAKLFYTARDEDNKRQAITAAPYVLKHPSGKGDIITFGTGRFLTASDKQSKKFESVYGVWDRYSDKGIVSPTTLPTSVKGRSDLLRQEFTELGINSGKFKLSSDNINWYHSGASGSADSDVENWGWYINLPRGGEKIIYDMVLYGRGLIFSTVRSSDDPCGAGMASTIYAVNPSSGGKTDYPPFDHNNDGLFDDKDEYTDEQVNGTDSQPGNPQIAGGKVLTSDGDSSLGVNHGMDLGRQSWRRQPKN